LVGSFCIARQCVGYVIQYDACIGIGERQFAPQLARHPGARRARLLNALQVACALHTWRLLRRDLGVAREEAEAIVRRLVTGALGG